MRSTCAVTGADRVTLVSNASRSPRIGRVGAMSRAGSKVISFRYAVAFPILAALAVGVFADRTMNSGPSLDDLWASAPAAARVWLPGDGANLPEPAGRYLTHAIAPRTPLASAVRLRMHGEIKLKSWLPFTAEQIIRSDGDML